jgi:DNA repair protein RadC
LLQHGATALKTSELLAILLRTGHQGHSAVAVGEQLLHHFGSLEGLSRASVPELAKIKGVGPVKAIELKAAFSLGARLSQTAAEARGIDSPADVFALLGDEMRILEYESIRVISLNTKHKILGIHEISRGTLNESLFHPREAFRPAIAHHAYGIVLVHNHPSGDPTPSTADYQITRRLKQAGEILQIEVVDHVIVGARALPIQNGIDLILVFRSTVVYDSFLYFAFGSSWQKCSGWCWSDY